MDADALLADLPLDGWTCDAPAGRLARPDGLALRAVLRGRWIDAWIQIPGVAREIPLLACLPAPEGGCAASLLAEALPRLYGPAGAAARRLHDLLGASWARAHRGLRATMATGDAQDTLVLRAIRRGPAEMVRRLPAPAGSALALVADPFGRVGYPRTIDPDALPTSGSAHARVALLDQAQHLAEACGADPKAVLRWIARDLAR